LHCESSDELELGGFGFLFFVGLSFNLCSESDFFSFFLESEPELDELLVFLLFFPSLDSLVVLSVFLGGPSVDEADFLDFF